MRDLTSSLEAFPPAKPAGVTHPRWLIIHVASGLEHATTGRSQYAFGALSVAIDEGFASKLLEAGHGFPNMSDVEFVEIVEAADPKFGAVA